MKYGSMRAVALFLVLLAAPAFAADPAVQPVQNFYDSLLDSMKHAKELGVKGRYEKLKPVIEQSFDMAGMTRLSVGPAWNGMSPQEQQGLVASLNRYTIASYASNFNGYDGEKFVVEPASTLRAPDRMVLSKLVTKSETIPFNYRMREVNGAWKVLDIFLNGYVSQIAKQRSDFGATVSAGGAAALKKKIDTLTDKLMKE
jgi:phospholipid transport system substrate-binding protein